MLDSGIANAHMNLLDDLERKISLSVRAIQ